MVLTAVKHAFPKQEVPHPFANDDVDLLWELNSLYGTLDHLHNVIQLKQIQQDESQ